MQNLEDQLAVRLSAAFASIADIPAPPLINRSSHADFQVNGALSLARRVGRPPRDVAADALAAADLHDLADGEVSGPGYINLTLRPGVLDRLLDEMAGDHRLGVPLVDVPEKVVIDYAAPNIAKEMHVGHLRSTIIGDALVRVLRWVGHDVRIVSHIGDWGTPFGMLLEWLIEIGENTAAHELSVGDLDTFYKAARKRFDEDPEFNERARLRVVALQQGDAESLRLWRLLVEESERYFMTVNARLGVLLTESDFVGESFYNDRLADVTDELDRLGLLRESQGALCVFPAGFTGRDGEPLPLIVRRSNGGFGYQATDLAAIRYRIRELHGQRLLYVVGIPQHQHLEMVFETAREAGWMHEGVRAQHVGFGLIFGPDGKMLASRKGRSVKLIELLDEAIDRATVLTAANNPELDPSEAAQIGAIVGIGALKYADLSSDMAKDYVFDLDRMLAFTGDTGVYLQFADARARSIMRKAPAVGSTNIRVVAPQERALALELLGFGAVVGSVAETLEPHRLAGYLRNVAVALTRFIEACPVLKAHEPTRESRLALLSLSSRVLTQGLSLLGISTPQRL
jgi:arginyl-tRNA synthetase